MPFVVSKRKKSQNLGNHNSINKATKLYCMAQVTSSGHRERERTISDTVGICHFSRLYHLEEKNNESWHRVNMTESGQVQIPEQGH